MNNKKRILILAPHTDDGELGCGATIAKFAAEGKEVFYVAFSDCKKSLAVNLPPDTLRNECRQATAVLGIKNENLIFYDYEVRVFSEQRQSILEQMVKLNKSLQPDLIFTPASSDLHQDHAVIFSESIRAFKQCSVLGYELPWNQRSFNTQCFIRLTKEEVQQKILALKKYQSQTVRSYFDSDFITSLAKVRGIQAGVDFAEAFECHNLVF